MADTQSNIKVSIDTTEALASIKNLQRQISAFHTSMAKGGAAANAVTAQMQQGLINSINATGKFSAQMKTIRTTTESFTNSLEKNKFSMGEYFRYAGGASKSFGKLFKTEFDTISKVARENVKDLQTQYIKMGRDANGSMKAIAVRPLSLDMNNLATKTMIASEKQAILNQLLKQGSTNLLNFGKNTQWAGRQLMVGFTVPLLTVGSAAAKTFMEMETQAIRFKKVYGDIFTPQAESVAALESIKNLGKEFTKYGVAVKDTVGLAADAAAAGFKGVDLQNQTTAATRLSILGQIDNQQALQTTIALQNAFNISSADLADNINFLNAVENQTVLSLDDVTTAIPKAAPVIQQLGGNVKDLAFFLTAMKQGGINASEGANALKSGLAAMINPTGKASAMLEGFGINIKNIVVSNKGNLKKTVIDFATALNQLDPLNRAQAIEQMFGKFQFARISTLMQNVTAQGTQASKVLDLAGASVQDLAGLSEKELGITADSAMNKFKASVENLKLSLVPVGEEFLKAVTPIAEFVTKILDKFNNLGDGTKKVIVTLTAIVAGLGPVLLMTFGLLANGLANIIKGFTAVKTLFNRTGESSATLGTEVKYMTLEQRNAAAVASSLDQVHKNLAQTFTAEASSVDRLTAAYARSIAAQRGFMPTTVPIGRGPIKKRADGKPFVVGGTGNKDSELNLLQPGETVIPTKMSKKYGSLINGMIADNIPGYKKGRGINFGGQRFDIPISSNEQALNEALGKFSKDLDGVTRVLSTLEKEAKSAGENFKNLNAETLKNTLDANGVPRNNPKGTSATVYDGEQYVFAHAKPQNPEIRDANQIRALADQTSSASLARDLRATADKGGKVQQLSSFGFMMPESANKKTDGGNFEMGRDKMASLFTGPQAERTLSPIYQSWAESNGLTLKDVLKDPKLTADMHTSVGAFGSLVGKEIQNLPENFGEKQFYEAVDKAVQRINKADTKLTKAVADMQQTSMLAVDNSVSGKALERRTVGKKDIGLRNAVGTPSNFTNYKDVGNKNFLIMGDRVAKEGGSKDAKAYTDAVKKGTQDIYVESRKRNSPHRLAAKDGADDAIAYSTAVQKSIDRQNRKLAKQGKPLIGEALIASSQTRKQRLAAKAKGIGQTAKRIGGKMNGAAGATALLGANMALSAAPDFAGKNIIQGTMSGASMGMLFGPWGAAAGAAIGLVSSALGALIEKQKIQKAMTEAAFKSSADMATFFGNAVVDTTLKVGSLSSSLGILGSTSSNSSFGYTNQELANFVALVGSLPEGNPLKDLITGLTDEKNPEKILNLAKAFVTTQVAIGQIKPDQAQKSLDLILATSDKASMVGSSFINLSSQVQAVSQSLKNASGSSLQLGTSLTDLIGAASNASSLAQLTAMIDGIAASGISAAQALGSMYNAYLLMGNIGAANSILNLNKVSGLKPEQIARAVVAASKGYTEAVGRSTNAQDFDKRVIAFLSNPKLWKPTTDAGLVKTRSYIEQEKEASITKTQINLLKKKKKIIDDQIKQQEKITNEIKRQNDYLDKQNDIDKQIVDAKIKGDYIGAANLTRQKQDNTAQFNKETIISELQAKSDALQVQIDALELKNTDIVNAINKSAAAQSASATADANRVITAIVGGYPSADKGQDGSTASKAFKIPATKEFVKPYIEKNAPANDMDGQKKEIYEKALDPKNAFTNAVYQTIFAKYVQSRIQQELDNLAKPGDSIVVSAVGSDGFTYTFRAFKDGRFTRGQKIAPVKKADGGHILGAGTATSDSIPAYLSNGEYVVKASSVGKYGVGLFDALNAQRFAIGSPGGVSPTPKATIKSTIGGMTSSFGPANSKPTIKSTLGGGMGSVKGTIETPAQAAERVWKEKHKTVTKIVVPPIRANFDTNSYKLGEQQKAELKAIAAVISKYRLSSLVVEGNADSRGGVDNDLLSLNRAKSTAAFLQALVPGTKFIPVGHGTYKPLVPNTSAENMALNRRAELFLPDQYKTIYPKYVPPAPNKGIIGQMNDPVLIDALKPKKAMGGLIKKFAIGGLANYSLPSYEVGSAYIPQDQIAQLHKGERVLTAEENKNFSASGPITNIININGTDLNKKEIAAAVMVELDRVQNKNNKTNMVKI